MLQLEGAPFLNLIVARAACQSCGIVSCSQQLLQKCVMYFAASEALQKYRLPKFSRNRIQESGSVVLQSIAGCNDFGFRDALQRNWQNCFLRGWVICKSDWTNCSLHTLQVLRQGFCAPLIANMNSASIPQTTLTMFGPSPQLSHFAPVT